MSKPVSGFSSIKYSLAVARKVGFRNFFKSISSKNTCKTCALGMGGQLGGMTNETGHFPEICKKSIQAQLTDIQLAIPDSVFRDTTISELKEISPRKLQQMGRLNTPLYKSREDEKYSPISWDEALVKIVSKLKEVSPDRTFFYSSGRSSNEAGFLLQLFVRVYGTNNINNCSYYCHQASGVGLTSTLGSGTATIVLEDLKHADLIWVIGANPSSNHPRLMTELLKCRRRGGKVIIVNPLKEPGLVRFKVPSDWRSMLLGNNQIATDYIQPNIGGDLALFKGIAKVLMEKSHVDSEFIANYTHGFDVFSQDVKETPWKEIVEVSGIDQWQIEYLAGEYSKAENVVFSWAMGITHHEHGVENVESIVNLALLRGMVGRKHAGLLPLRGHSNVQGVGSMGVTPVLKEKVFKNIEEFLGIQLPKQPGLDTMASMKAAFNDEIDFALLLGGNLYSATPDAAFADTALNRIPFKTFVTTTLNQSHLYGVEGEVVILPVAARDEEKQATTQESMFNFVRMSDGGIVRLDNVRSEVEIIADIAEGVLGQNGVDFSSFKTHRNIRKAIAHTIPGFEKIGEIDETKEEFKISGRTFHEPQFATPDGKAHFKVVPIPSLKGGDTEFQLTSVRSEGQFNTIVYEEEDTFRGIDNRWVVMMNADDMISLGVVENDRVDIHNETGIMKSVVVKSFDVTIGNVAAFFPEANVLIPTILDPRSKTPGFKSNAVKIIPTPFT